VDILSIIQQDRSHRRNYSGHGDVREHFAPSKIAVQINGFPSESRMPGKYLPSAMSMTDKSAFGS
jgi:hypothetical protein